MKLPKLLLMSAAFGLLLARCSSTPVAGNSTDTGNARVSCTVHLPGGEPARDALVRIRPQHYRSMLPGTNQPALPYPEDRLTDDRGRFVIDSVSPGSYIIEVTDRTAFALRIDVSVESPAGDYALPSDTLRPFSAIQGTVTGSRDRTIFVQIKGLERLVPVDPATGIFTIGDLPAGGYHVIVAEAYATAAAIPVMTGPLAPAQILTLDTVSAPLRGWKHSSALLLNTTASGAALSEAVEHFPLRILLDSTNFDFSQTRPDGADVRCVRVDGSEIPIGIEQWDSSAVLWVLLDSVYPDAVRHYGTLVWGNDSVISGPVEPTPFDTADGFRGVWHLGGNDFDGDATHGNHRLLDGGTDRSEGVIGECRYFDGQDSMKAAAHPHLEPSSFTVSCWFRRDGEQSGYNKLVCKGDVSAPHQSYTLEIRDSSSIAGFQTARTDSAHVTLETGSVIADRTWYQLSGTFDATTGMQILYLDGIPFDSVVNATPIEYYPSAPWELYIGAQRYGDKNASFKGWIDEVRVESIPRSPAWIRMCFETQRPGSRVVVLE